MAATKKRRRRRNKPAPIESEEQRLERRLSPKNRSLLRQAKEAVETMENKAFGEFYVYALKRAMLYKDNSFLEFAGALEQPFVSIETFIDSEEFLGATDLTLWPEVRETVVELNRHWWKGPSGAYKEILLMGATSTGKSEIAKVTQAYHLHILGCMKNPQAFYGLPSATSIVFPLIAAKPHVIKKILYQPLRHYIETMPWFQKHLRPHKLIESEMYFDNKNIRVVPAGTDTDAILGEATIGGILDEVNFMNVVQQSKRADVSTGRPGVYDQAQQIYSAITRRKKGRFLRPGPLIGIVCVSSSTRYKGDFTDKRKKAVEEQDDRSVFVYDRAQYDVWPSNRYSGQKVRVLVANEAASDVQLLAPEDPDPRNGQVIHVPIEYETDFRNDPAGALRDVCGLSTKSANPFIRNQRKIDDAIALGEEMGLSSILVKDNVILGFDGMPVVKKGMYCTNPSKPRYVHIDLSNTGDRCGIAMVRFDGLKEVVRETGEVEILPMAAVEVACTIEPDHVTEIDLAEIRMWVAQLKRLYGYPIKCVTYDAWNSLESRQAWKKQGVKSGKVSVDRSTAPYKNFRDSLYDGRIALYPQDMLVEELVTLEYDEKKDKIDHPPKGHKDCADAVCGAYYTMLSRSNSWNGFMTTDSESDAMEMAMRPDAGDRADEDRPL